MDQQKPDTFKIHSFKWHKFEELITKINKKAEKLGLPGVSFIEIGREHIPAIEVWDTFVLDGEFDRMMDRYRPAHDLIEVKLIGQAPFISGWTLVAVLEHSPDFELPLVHAVPEQVVPVHFRKALPNCEHCGHQRTRKETFVLRNVESGEFKQIGRNCLAYFLPGISPERAAEICSFYSDPVFAGEFEDDDHYDGGYAINWDRAEFDLLRLWAITSAVIRKDGWVSKSMAIQRGLGAEKTTSFAVREIIQPPARFSSEADYRKYKEFVQERIPTEQDRDVAVKTLSWLVNEVGDTDEYMHNLKVIANNGRTNSRNMSLCVSAVGSYLKHLDALEKRKRDDSAPSEWQGEPKQRLRGLLLEVYTVKYWDSHFGTTTFVGFKDQFGNIFVWKASGSLDIHRGEKYSVTGTVKEHGDFKGTRQTVLSRCKIEKVGEPEEKYPWEQGKPAV